MKNYNINSTKNSFRKIPNRLGAGDFWRWAGGDIFKVGLIFENPNTVVHFNTLRFES